MSEFPASKLHYCGQENKNASTDPIEAQAFTVAGERAKKSSLLLSGPMPSLVSLWERVGFGKCKYGAEVWRSGDGSTGTFLELLV